jgi:adenylate cyclase
VNLAALLLLLGLGVASVAWWRARERGERLRERLVRSNEALTDLQLAFSRFAPDEVIERVIAEGVGERGEEEEVTVLFADLVAFTSLTRQVEPDVLVRILNGYFDRMSQAISEHRGHVSTFIGDGILAFFGAHAPNPWQSNDAAHAALAMRRALADYNAVLTGEGLPELRVGVGLQRGVGVAGLVGSRDLMEFAFVGPPVTEAARVQELTRHHEADIITTRPVVDALDPRFRVHALPPAELKGIEEALEVFGLDGFSEADVQRLD